jgi:hypothetical protein
MQEWYATARRILQDAVVHLSQGKMNVLWMTLGRWYQLIVPVCVCKLFFCHFAARRGDMSAACRHVCYPVSELANLRQSTYRK